MSVNTSEEYLDELLQSIEPIIYANQPKTEPEPVIESETMENRIIEEVDDTSGVLGNLTEITSEEPDFTAVEEISFSNEENGVAGLLQEDSFGGEVAQSEPDVAMDDLLAALVAEEPATEEAFDIDAMLNAAAGAAESASDSAIDHDADVKALLQQFSDDEDLSDIGDILERNDNNEAVDESLLEKPAVELFQMEENEEAEEKKKESKGLFGFMKKKKNKKDSKKKEAQEEEVLSEESPAEPIVEIAEEPVMEVMAETDFFGDDLLREFEGKAEASEDLAAMSLDDLFAEGDMTDIDALLSAGAFDEVGIESLASGKEAEGTDGKDKKESTKKETFFSKLFTMLTEEDEEEEPKKGSVPEASATGITDENETILEELSKEEKKKRKKEEKEQKKKEKEAKKKGKDAPEGEEAEEGQEEDDKKKKKKKVKKEKPRKVTDIDEKPTKKLSKKKVSIVFVFCFSILALILILHTVLLDFNKLKEARWAFDNADYETCYANLYGEERSEQDEAIFQKSYIILSVQRKWDSYLNLKQMDMDVEALDALFEGVRVYRNMQTRAESYGILSRITPIFESVYSELQGYGLSDTEIEEILAYESKVTYTKHLESIVNGTPFVLNEWLPESAELEEVTEEPQPLEDVLPMEEDFLPDDTSLVGEMNQTVDVPIQEEPQAEVPVVQEQGNTVVVGSAPVDISGNTQAPVNVGGTNVGSGSTNISAEVNGNTVFVN